MALLGTTALNANMGIESIQVSDVGDDTNMQLVIKYYWYDGLTLVQGVTSPQSPYDQDPDELNDAITAELNGIYDDAHP